MPIVLYEAPHRILPLLADIEGVLGQRSVAIGRELTKRHESLAIRPISTWLAGPPPALGEFVLVVLPEERVPCEANAPSEAELADEFYQLTEKEGFGRREALKAVAVKFSVTTKAVFAAVDKARKLAE